MSYTVDKTGLIESLLIKDLLKINLYLLLVLEIYDVLFEISEHLLNLEVSAAMLGSFE